MCKILDRMVLVKVSIGGGQISKQDKAKTEQLRSQSGNKTFSVTTKLYPKGTFDSVTEPLKAFKALVRTKALSKGEDAEYMTPVTQVAVIRKAHADTLAVVSPAMADIQARHDAIVAEAISMRGGDVQPDDYPAVFPMNEWFPLEVTWRPHPKESALSSAIRESELQLAEDLEAEMANKYTSIIQAGRDDLMARVKTALGGFGRKCQRLRTDTCECPKCHHQFAACTGTTCPRCDTADCPVHGKEVKVYESLFTDLNELCDTLGVMLPEDMVAKGKVGFLMEPVLRLDPNDLRDASPEKLEQFEDSARKVAQDLAEVIADTFV